MSGGVDRVRAALAAGYTIANVTVVAALDSLREEVDRHRVRTEAAEADVARLRRAVDGTLTVLRHLADGMALDHAYPALAAMPVPIADALGALVADRDAARADAAALRAIVEGGDVAPTDEEIAAHAAAHGVWLVTRRSGFGRAIAYGSDEARRLATWPDTRWWALDAAGRPCPWPTVTP